MTNFKTLKKESKKAVDNIIETTEVVMPALKGISPKLGTVVDTTIKAKNHAGKPTVDTKELAADIMAASTPFVKAYSPNGALVLQVSAKSLKIKYKPTDSTTDNINTVLQVASAVTPIINRLNPPVGAGMEVIVNLAKLYNKSKLTFTNEELGLDLTAALTPAIKLVNKKTGITMEVLVNASKTETGAEAIKSLKFKVSNFSKPLNENALLETNKNSKELQSTKEESEWIVKYHSMYTDISKDTIVQEFLIKELSEVWELEKNPNENNKDLQKSIVEKAVEKAQSLGYKLLEKPRISLEIEDFEDIELVELESNLSCLLQNYEEVMSPLGQSSGLIE